MFKAPEWPLPAETLVKKLRDAPFRESHLLNTYFLNSRGGVDREFYSGFCGILFFFHGFWAPGGVPAARPQNSASDGLRESPR